MIQKNQTVKHIYTVMVTRHTAAGDNIPVFTKEVEAESVREALRKAGGNNDD